jgi:diacylglycerol kinase (ATP)
MKHVFIVNPISGKGSSAKALPIINNYCQQQQLDYEIIMTESVGHAKQISNSYSIRDEVCLYAVGGDGTIHEVLNGLQDQVPMAIIPTGSGNDFFASLTKQQWSLDELIIETIKGEFMAVDYGIANSYRFINMLAVGFDAEINYLVNEKFRNLPMVPPKLVYMMAALYKISKPTKHQIKLTVDNQSYQYSCILTAIMNGKHYGGGFTPTPMAKVNDGWLDLLHIDFVGPIQILGLLGKYFKGDHVNLPIAHFMRGKDIIVETPNEAIYSLDGEIMKEKLMHIRLMAGSLRMRLPIRIIQGYHNENQ